MKKRDKTPGDFDNEILRGRLRQLRRGESAAPESLKRDVFSSLDTLQLMADITGLFTIQFAQAELELLDAIASSGHAEEEE